MPAGCATRSPTPHARVAAREFDPRAPVSVRWRFWEEADRRERFVRDSLGTGGFLLKWLTVAFLAESLMMAYVPAESVAAVLGGDSAFAIPLAAVVGVPAYMNGYAAIPLISGLLEMGMSNGAALAFATAGAVSCIPAAIAVWALVRRSVFVLYLALGLGGAILSGFLYQVAASRSEGVSGPMRLPGSCRESTLEGVLPGARASPASPMRARAGTATVIATRGGRPVTALRRTFAPTGGEE